MYKRIIIFLIALWWPFVLSAEDRLIEFSDLQYQGAFRVPGGDYGSPLYSGFNYGGRALTYNPHNNSLFLVGHAHHQLVAEISIPEPVNSQSIEDLNTAAIIQEFHDPTEGNRSNLGEGGAEVNTSGTPLGGFLVWGEKLIGTAYGYYDAASVVRLSHYTSGIDLSVSDDFEGMFAVGQAPETPNPAFVDGYIGTVPGSWQERFGGPALTGNCCLSIIGRTSLGPAVSVFDPDTLGVVDPAPATPLLGYPISQPTLGTYGDTDPASLYNGSMAINGVVFPDGSRTILFFGKRGKGEFCYGAGVSDPSLHMTNCDPDYPTVLCCYDPVSGSKGGHSYPYVYLVLAYDALELLSVKNGDKEMWEILPYAQWELSFPHARESANILGAAYDPGEQKIYISQDGGDRPGCCGHLPLIHVYKLDLKAAESPTIVPTLQLLLTE